MKRLVKIILTTDLNINIVKHVDDDCLAEDNELFQVLNQLNAKADVFICPVCKRQLKSKATFNNHIANFKSVEHDQYRQKLELLKKTYNAVEQLEDLNNLGCGNDKFCYNCPCAKCCYLIEHTLFEKNYKRLNKVEKQAKTKVSSLAAQLLDEFYAQRGGISLQQPKEIHQLKVALNTFSIEQVQVALKLLIARGDTSLKYFGNKIIVEAIKYLEIKPLLTVKDSIPYLIKQYYIKLNLFVSAYTLLQDYLRVEQLVYAHQLTEEQTIFAIKYMIDKKVVPFAYLNSRITEILYAFNQQQQQQQTKINSVSNEDYLNSIMTKLQNGTITYMELINIYGQQPIFDKYILDILTNQQYNKAFSAIEWLYKIDIPLTENLYFTAKRNTINSNEKLYHFGNDNEIKKFKLWLKDWKYKYEAEKIK